MNCYAGLAKRIVKSCFLEVKPHQVIPVPQLQPLDASKIIKPKSISDEETSVEWAEAKAQEREAAALKAVSETDTDESYDSDDSEVGVPIQPVLKSALFGGDDDDEDDDKVKELVRCIVAGWVATSKKYRAATIIQATARGRALRAWKAQFRHELAREMSRVRRAWYHSHISEKNGKDAIKQFAEQFAKQWNASRTSLEFTSWVKSMFDEDAIEQQLAEQWMVSSKCVKAWILLAEQHQ